MLFGRENEGTGIIMIGIYRVDIVQCTQVLPVMNIGLDRPGGEICIIIATALGTDPF